MSRLVLLAALVTGCSRPSAHAAAPAATVADAEPQAKAAQPTSTAGDDLEQIEASLLREDFQLRFEIEATGAAQARLAGDLRCRGSWLALRATGTFGGNTVDVSLTADGERLTGSSGAAKLDFERPAELREAVVVGLTRMGILHNLAVVIAGRPPDHAEGGVREWVQVSDVVADARVAPEALTEAARREASDAISFTLLVAGNEAGEATLWWDRETSLPVERHQIVRFPEGEMHVRETYTAEQ